MQIHNQVRQCCQNFTCECQARGMLPYIKLLYTHLRISNLLAPSMCS
jgi:hypothetical protein